MDVEKIWTLEDGKNTEFDRPSDPFGEASEKPRSKTSLRIHFEAQVEAIKKQVGDLENVRQNLGLSQRKICQLLMVDPSAWSRWTKGSGEAPPHIYRALQWYLILQEKIPGLTAPYFIGRTSGSDMTAVSEQRIEQIHAELRGFREKSELLDQEKSMLQNQVQELENQVRANRVGFYFLVVALLILGVSLGLFFRGAR